MSRTEMAYTTGSDLKRDPSLEGRELVRTQTTG